MEENEAKTVHFDVGGQLYRVARSLLEQYPSSMLYCAAAERWQTDPKATIFIEGDGERFRYCLDYMRHQRVHLPLTIPKAAVLADLDYYGFHDVDPLLVNGNSDIDELAELNEKIMDLELKRAFLRCASEMHAHVVRTGSLTIKSSKFFQRLDNNILKNIHEPLDGNSLKVLNGYLARHGLLLHNINWPYSVTLIRLSEGPLPK